MSEGNRKEHGEAIKNSEVYLTTTGKQNPASFKPTSPIVPPSGLISEIVAAQKGDTLYPFAQSNGKLFVAHLFLVEGAECAAVQNVKDPAMLTKLKSHHDNTLYKWNIVLVTDSADCNWIPGWRRILCGSGELMYVACAPQVVLYVKMGESCVLKHASRTSSVLLDFDA